jgi:hypothetical protein
MNSNKVSVSQTQQASQIRFFKLAVDTLFLRMENNLSGADDDHMYNDEDSIIELADRITEMYECLDLSDDKKSELRQYILKCADTFDSKFGITHDKCYIDNYLEFVSSSDYDFFEAEKIKSEDQYKIKKCKVVYESDSEAEDEVPMQVISFKQWQKESDEEELKELRIENDKMKEEIKRLYKLFIE